MYMMLKIAEFSRLFQSIEKQFFFRSSEICVRAFQFCLCCCSFPEYVFVTYGTSFCSVDGTWQIVKYRFSKSTIVSAHGFENKTTASQKSEKKL